MIELPEKHLLTVKKILNKHVPNCEVRVFGSRANGKTKTYSDLDLALVAQNELPDTIVRVLKEEFAESDLPFRVDIHDWHSLSPEFRAVIEKSYKVL